MKVIPVDFAGRARAAGTGMLPGRVSHRGTDDHGGRVVYATGHPSETGL
jgi:hypothetical protein